ncbi:prolipoprotein diacylglyceryl transferase [Trichlorobacter lovleyi]|uniref:prolipoprotein diacylglyceryl transferase family protein n=1 Tax=Trichlorobacter lovleyi TaxID=313985 RepID=UPI0022402359|nr:prolipoprotein diacylglyceryl transferase family protein [Trichlorobacter lovleyi]QOX77833.1 prolipoprotein diacylglyceryl transferase [Trichlorobacter lovleyi]
MSAVLFLLAASCLLGAYLWWGFRFLPAERWQIVAAVPTAKDPHGNGWLGINITWYGLLTANAYLVAVAVLLVLLGAVGVPPLGTALLAAAMLCCCVPASRLVARIVEKKAHTFTVGGAVFVGIIITPFLIQLLNRLAGPWLGFQIPVMAAYAAIAIAYAFGEGLGRLACISFGCCYGRPVPQDGGLLHRLFNGRGFVFLGSTKKIAYADGMESVEVLPVQALTAVLYTVCGLLATALFLDARHAAAFLLATTVTQGWRSFSETMRADYRGAGRISAYQVMGLIGVLYAFVMVWLLGGALPVPAQLAVGLQSLWNPALLLFLQGIWCLIFFYTGRSTVTGATLSFHVHRDRI